VRSHSKRHKEQQLHLLKSAGQGVGDLAQWPSKRKALGSVPSSGKKKKEKKKSACQSFYRLKRPLFRDYFAMVLIRGFLGQAVTGNMPHSPSASCNESFPIETRCANTPFIHSVSPSKSSLCLQGVSCTINNPVNNASSRR